MCRLEHHYVLEHKIIKCVVLMALFCASSDMLVALATAKRTCGAHKVVHFRLNLEQQIFTNCALCCSCIKPQHWHAHFYTYKDTHTKRRHTHIRVACRWLGVGSVALLLGLDECLLKQLNCSEAGVLKGEWSSNMTKDCMSKRTGRRSLTPFSFFTAATHLSGVHDPT